MEEAQLSSATSTKSLSPATRRKGYRGAGSLRERTTARICSALSTHNHHRFVLSIGQYGSTLLQETCMSEIAETYIHNNTDILNRKDGYLMIIFSFSFIDYIYYITTIRYNTLKEKGLKIFIDIRIFFQLFTTLLQKKDFY